MDSRLIPQSNSQDVRSLHTSAEVVELAGTTVRRLRSWQRVGLIHPAEQRGATTYFNFEQISQARTLNELANAGYSAKRIRRWLDQKSVRPNTFANTSVLHVDGRPMLRRAEGKLVELSGQLLLELDDEPENHLALRSPEFEIVLADNCLHAANAMYAEGQFEKAKAMYEQAVQHDPEFAEAWNNLGIALSELDDACAAIRAISHALELDPSFVDAHYNLADCLECHGRYSEARHHWHIYAQHDPTSPWGVYARGRLDDASAPE